MLKVTFPGMEVLLTSQVYETWPLPPGAIEICALKTIFSVVPQAIAPKLFGFIEIATPASCKGVLVTFEVTEDVGEPVACGIALDAVGVREPVPDCDGAAKHALKLKLTNVTNKRVSGTCLSIATPWLR